MFLESKVRGNRPRQFRPRAIRVATRAAFGGHPAPRLPTGLGRLGFGCAGVACGPRGGPLAAPASGLRWRPAALDALVDDAAALVY